MTNCPHIDKRGLDLAKNDARAVIFIREIREGFAVNRVPTRGVVVDYFEQRRSQYAVRIRPVGEEEILSADHTNVWDAEAYEQAQATRKAAKEAEAREEAAARAILNADPEVKAAELALVVAEGIRERFRKLTLEATLEEVAARSALRQAEQAALERARWKSRPLEGENK